MSIKKVYVAMSADLIFPLDSLVCRREKTEKCL